MGRFVDRVRDVIPSDIFNDVELLGILEGSPDSRYGLIRRSIAAGEILSLKRGVYAFGRRYQRKPINLFEVAHKLSGPSYVSMESALAHHGWIPEATYTVTSVSSRRTATYETSLGLFTFVHLPRFNYIGVERVVDQGSIFLMATPTKALADYVLANKLEDASIASLTESLRLDPSAIGEVSVELLQEISSSSHSRRLLRFARNSSQAVRS